MLRQAIAQALEGDGTTLIATADILIGRRPDGTYTNQTEANMAINCVDRVYPRDLDGLPPRRRGRRSRPRFGAYIAWGSLPCAYWPVKGDDTGRRITAEGAPPIVVIGTTRDPATPYEWAQALSTQLNRAG